MIEPKPGTLAEPEMHARLVEALGVVDGELDALTEAAGDGLDAFQPPCRKRCGKQSQNCPVLALRALPKLRAKSFGWRCRRRWIVGLCSRLAVSEAERSARLDTPAKDLRLAMTCFNSILNSPSGLIILKQAV